MAYDDRKDALGRELVYFIEIDQDYCSNTYGIAPCTASGPAPLKCFNCIRACQDVDNYDATNPSPGDTRKIYRFSSKRLDGVQGTKGETFRLDDSPTFPTITGVTMTPTKLDPGNGLGSRSTLKVQLMDQAWSDVGIDPYVDERTGDPDAIGSFWGKWLARNQYYEGRTIRIFTGYLADDGSYEPANFIERAYLLHRISGPSSKGVVSIEAKDPLKRADNERAQWPPVPQVAIAEDINASVKTFDVTDAQTMSDWLAAGQEYIRIDDEILQMTSVNVGNGTITCERAIMPAFYQASTNIAEEHDDETDIQLCYEFLSQRIDYVIYDLLFHIAGIPDEFLDSAQWSQIIEDSGYSTYNCNTLLAEPNGVKDLLQELCQNNIFIWWDERTQLVKMGTLLPTDIEGALFNEDTSIVEGSVSVTVDVKARLTQVWFAHGHRNPTLDLDKEKNFREVKVSVGTNVEDDTRYGDVKVKRVFSRWFTDGQDTTVSEISNRTLIDNAIAAQTITMELDAKDDDHWTGATMGVATSQIQDAFGSPEPATYRVLSVNEQLSPVRAKYKYVLKRTFSLDRSGLIAPDTNPEGEVTHADIQVTHDGIDVTNGAGTFPDYSGASDGLRSRYAFIAYDDRGDGIPGFLDGTDAYQIS